MRIARPALALLALPLALMLGACGGNDADTTPAATAEPAPAPAAAPAAPVAEAAPAAPAGFDPASVPESTATLPPPPFFAIPEGLTSTFDDKDKVINFDRQFFIAGDKPVAMEGKIWRDRFSLTNGERTYTDLEFRKNYENLILAMGGRKINTTGYTREVIAAAGGRDAMEKANYAAALVPDYAHDIYLLRQGGKEWWIDISTGAFPLHGYVVVLEKAGMQQTVALLDAAAMKQALDKDGKVALYINFDLDKATLRPDAQPVIEEITKLLTNDPALKLSIEGHTDNTGDAAHNRTLSAARARSVLGALVGAGIDPARLASTGHGADKPMADNATDDGRAKNRRVELVRR